MTKIFFCINYLWWHIDITRIFVLFILEFLGYLYYITIVKNSTGGRNEFGNKNKRNRSVFETHFCIDVWRCGDNGTGNIYDDLGRRFAIFIKFIYDWIFAVLLCAVVWRIGIFNLGPGSCIFYEARNGCNNVDDLRGDYWNYNDATDCSIFVCKSCINFIRVYFGGGNVRMHGAVWV